MINLDTMTLPELLEIQNQLPKLIARRLEEARIDVTHKAASLAAKHGLTLEDLVRKGRKRQVRRYVNPADSDQVWSGVGSRPKWVRDWIASGHALDELKVNIPQNTE